MRYAEELRRGRERAGLTQERAAKRLGLSQGYLSLLENGKRAATARVRRAAGRVYRLPSALPLPSVPGSSASPEELVRNLAALGYPGYAHVRPGHLANPAEVALKGVTGDRVDARAVRALPWVLSRHSDLNWEWLVDQTKRRNAQNRLGFLVSLAREIAESDPVDPHATARLRDVENELKAAKLVAESTLGRVASSERERDWMRENRSETARSWNVLSTLTADQVRSAG